MESQEIWGLILRADDVVKHRGATGRQRAVRWLRQAKAQAIAIGDAALAQQAQLRLDHLDPPEGTSSEGTSSES